MEALSAFLSQAANLLKIRTNKRSTLTGSTDIYTKEDVQKSLHMAELAIKHKNIVILALQAKLEQKLLARARVDDDAVECSNDISSSSSCGASEAELETTGAADGRAAVTVTAAGNGLDDKQHAPETEINRLRNEVQSLTAQLQSNKTAHSEELQCLHRHIENLRQEVFEKEGIVSELASLIASREASELALVETVQGFINAQTSSLPATPRMANAPANAGIEGDLTVATASQQQQQQQLDAVNYWSDRLQTVAAESTAKLARAGLSAVVSPWEEEQDDNHGSSADDGGDDGAGRNRNVPALPLLGSAGTTAPLPPSC